ncbi:XRE family transcriptional regulator [Sphaerospermopsis aphanizomenoides BCCUSP55]|uniref:nucleoside 2-deoxyribosyltransferase n=1 Tax=Sphaerospermopsis aphanizomenoides TaxID=459663 RepID=UPI0019071BC0|nr:nucleoside 2-deoxyribosyltransferase [Sphaerospermopsis aphanizomenoides]MBK1987857.1 XRE family transcriptional regulator [Sphaerospermopsis aphanizomenoides BCCUSP55]
MYKIYVSGALTDVENPIETKALYEKIGSVCEEVGLQAYVPHLHTDPVNNPDITPREVFDQDKHQVSISDLVIAYLGSLSFGVGMELAYAENNKIPIILLYETGKRISRFPRGIPTVIAEIQFNNGEDALNQLKNVLLNWKNSI